MHQRNSVVPMSIMRPFAFRSAALVSSVVLAGCSQSCRDDKPYVPYSIPSAASSPAPSDSAPPPAASAQPQRDRFEPQAAQKLPSGTTRIEVAGGWVSAPAGAEFSLVLHADFDDDGNADALLWARDRTGGGQLMHIRGKAGGQPTSRAAVTLPADLINPQCKGSQDLVRVGPHTAAVRASLQCDNEKPRRWVAVIMPSRTQALRQTFEFGALDSGESLELELDALDRDGDGFDDLQATFTLQGKANWLAWPDPGPMTVKLQYFDRPAGLSREPHEPAASLRTLAGQASAIRKQGWEAVASASARVRQLHDLLCAEGRHASVKVQGAALNCAAQEAVSRVEQAEAEAAVQAGNVLWALSVLDRMQSAALYDADKVQRVRQRIEQSLGVQDTDGYHLPFAPAPSAQPGWTGLAFASGALLIRTANSVMRFDPRSRVALPDPPEGPIQSWSEQVRSPDGALWLQSVRNACDGGFITAHLEPTAPGTEPLVALVPVLARPVASCPSEGWVPADTRVLGWSNQGLELLVHGAPVSLVIDRKHALPGYLSWSGSALGSARSPDGKLVVHASTLGLVVVGTDSKARLWQAEAFKGQRAELQQCAVADGAAAVACVDGKRTRVLVPQAAQR